MVSYCNVFENGCIYIYIYIFFLLTYSNKNLPRRELLDLSDIIGAVNDDSLSCVAVEYI